MVLQPGTWITETVRMERRLAVGGMAEVWRAEHLGLGLAVAVKSLAPRLARSQGQVRRFLAEARIVSQIDDPHTVRVLDCVVRRSPDGERSAFIVMELLEGEDLGRQLDRGGTLALEATAAVAQQVASALDTAHALGFVHRDVKPENIFLAVHAGHQRVKLLDFGVAKDLGRAPGLTMVGVTLGTPQYMSPEQLRGARDVDARSDVWSLAVVSYRCLTGAFPFEGRTVAAVSTAIHEGVAPPPSERRGDLPRSVDAIFARAFHPKIDSRFQSARELADALVRSTQTVSAPAPDAPTLPAVSTVRVRIIDEALAPSPSIPFELVKPRHADGTRP